MQWFLPASPRVPYSDQLATKILPATAPFAYRGQGTALQAGGGEVGRVVTCGSGSTFQGPLLTPRTCIPGQTGACYSSTRQLTALGRRGRVQWPPRLWEAHVPQGASCSQRAFSAASAAISLPCPCHERCAPISHRSFFLQRFFFSNL